jgi:hypothetical protein
MIRSTYSNLQLYDRGILTLDELIELEENLDPDWVEEQRQLIEDNHVRFWMADTEYRRKRDERL